MDFGSPWYALSLAGVTIPADAINTLRSACWSGWRGSWCWRSQRPDRPGSPRWRSSAWASSC